MATGLFFFFLKLLDYDWRLSHVISKGAHGRQILAKEGPSMNECDQVDNCEADLLVG